MSEQIQDVRQTIMKLPYFNEEVPVLYLSDGTPYIPVVILCRILGIQADGRIRRWRKLLFWNSTCKLPLQTEKRGKRVVWCLPFGAFPLWLSCINWNAVLPERRKQLLNARDELTELPKRVHLEMLVHYRQVRRFLFWFLVTYENADIFLEQWVQQLQPVIDGDEAIWLEELVAEGRSIINEAIDVARKMLRDQEGIPIVDAWKVDHYGNVLKTFSLPLLPIVSQEDEEQLIQCINMLKEWYQDIRTFFGDIYAE